GQAGVIQPGDLRRVAYRLVPVFQSNHADRDWLAGGDIEPDVDRLPTVRGIDGYAAVVARSDAEILRGLRDPIKRLLLALRADSRKGHNARKQKLGDSHRKIMVRPARGFKLLRYVPKGPGLWCFSLRPGPGRARTCAGRPGGEPRVSGCGPGRDRPPGW